MEKSEIDWMRYEMLDEEIQDKDVRLKREGLRMRKKREREKEKKKVKSKREKQKEIDQ